MSDHRLSDIENLFQAVSGLPHSEQLAYLEMHCKDPTLKAEVLELLRYDRVEQGGLPDSIHEPSSTLEEAGSCIGPYKLLQKIGEGGMGVVYMAEQQEPVRRRVALKIIKLGMDTKQVVARFEAERQALAMMDHPNIARVLDAGTTDTGRPYFVMDLVQGVPITEFCEKSQLSTTARLLLFVQVCQAIRGAHQKGIIHRDIKPSNVLVTLQHSEPTPIVIDFGIAKAINQSLTTKTYFTEYGAMIGTPAYMSPEQAEMSSIDVDTRTDVYSLGALLYEMLTGTAPFSEECLRSVSYAEMCRIIAEETPEKPSTRSRSRARQAEVTCQEHRKGPAPEHRIASDLDWISMKCLEKDRRRRYDTASELIADIKRFLNNEPVSAAAPTLSYQLQKLYQRNRTAGRLLVALFAALLFGLLGVTWQWREAVEQRSLKEQQRQLAVLARQKAELAEQLAKEEEMAARKALYASYVARADLELRRNKISTTREVLKRCPEELRGWEWYALKSWTHGDLFTLEGHSNAVFDVEYSPDGKFIASCAGPPSWRGPGHESGPTEIILWDARSGKAMHMITGHSHVIHDVSFSPDGSTLSSASQDGTVRLWDVSTAEEKPGSPLTVPGGATSAAFSADGEYLAAGGYNGRCWIWNRDSLELVRTFEDDNQAAIFGLGFTPDTSTLIASAYDGILYDPKLMIWESNSGQARDVKAPNAVYGRAFAISPDGASILTAQDTQFMLRGSHDGAIQAHSERSDGAVRDLAFDRTGSRIASCGDDGLVRIWTDGNWAKESMRLYGHEGRVSSISFSPVADRLVSGGWDGKVKIWDLTRTSPEISDVPMTWLLWGYPFAAISSQKTAGI